MKTGDNTRGGARERAGRPQAPFVSVKLYGIRRCRNCGRFAGVIKHHYCPKTPKKGG